MTDQTEILNKPVKFCIYCGEKLKSSLKETYFDENAGTLDHYIMKYVCPNYHFLGRHSKFDAMVEMDGAFTRLSYDDMLRHL